MADLIILNCTTGSRVPTVICPICGRISRQILSNSFSNGSIINLGKAHTCPVCSNTFTRCTTAGSTQWSAAYNRYNANPSSYNDAAKENYQKSTQRSVERENVTRAGTLPTPPAPVFRAAQSATKTGGIANSQGVVDNSNAAKPAETKATQATDVVSVPEVNPETLTGAKKLPDTMTGGHVRADDLEVLDRRIELWKHQLLDLGKRNRMINYRETKRSTLRIIEPGFSELFNRLAIREEELTFQRPIDKDSDLRTFSMLSLLETLSYPLPVHVGDIKTEGSIVERQKTLHNLRNKAKLAKDEQGTNILYLSFGFVEWKENNKESSQWLKSPLLMMPVTLTLETIHSPYTLSRYDDEIEVNPTLDYLFNEQYGLDLPTFELKDESSIDEYLQQIEEIVDKRGWKLIREVSMGLLSFLKISMYHDLNNHRGRMMGNPTLRAIAGDISAANQIPAEYQNFAFDEVSPRDWYQVVNADSSQQEAILLSKMGVSFVMQGPPGTGKSQTITNIIAEGLADGKRILFVSEKAAALQVVLKRLTEVQLDDFCLALHSHKANKKDILENIGANLKLPHQRVKDSVVAELDELFHDRKHLNAYADELHKEIEPLGESLYTAFGKYAKLETVPEIQFAIDNIHTISSSQFNTMLYCVASMEKAVLALGMELKKHPWNGTTITQASQSMKNEFMKKTETLEEQLAKLNNTLNEIYLRLGLPGAMTLSGATSMAEFLEQFVVVPLFPEHWSNEDKRRELLTVAVEEKEKQQQYLVCLERVKAIFSETILKEDLETWLTVVRESLDNVKKCGNYRNSSDSDIIGGINELAHYGASLEAEWNEVYQAYLDVKSVLGVDFGSNFGAISDTSEVVTSVLNTSVVLREWLNDSAATEVKKMLLQGQMHADTYKGIKQEILNLWEESVFDIDVDGMLMRFKTEYVNFFKVFKASYKEDIKAIRAVRKAIGGKINDAMVISLLQQIKMLQAEEKWFNENGQQFSSAIGIHYNGVDTQWQNLLNAFELIRKVKDCFGDAELPENLISILCNKDANSDKLEQITTAGSVLSKDKLDGITLKLNSITSDFKDPVFATDNDDILARIQLLSKNTALLKTSVDNMREFVIDTTTIPSIVANIEDANIARQYLLNLEKRSTEFEGLFENRYEKINTSWNDIISDIEAVNSLFENNSFSTAAPEFVRTYCNNEAERNNLDVAATDIRILLSSVDDGVTYFASLFSNSEALLQSEVSDIASKVSACRKNVNSLDLWIDYRETSDECIKNGLQKLVELVSNQEIPTNEIKNVFEKQFYKLWITTAMEKSPAVQNFRRRTQEEKLDHFVELDTKQLSVAQMRIREKIISRFPDTNRVTTAKDELQVLQRELGKKRRIMPLRMLFRSIPNLLLTLKPCLMMSPLSVAYFLEADSYQFDMVIFDEASQIFPQDAIGAIFRGKQVIIAGDTKQLPPTNFFATSTSNDSDAFDSEDEYEDVVYDSILEETASVLPNRTLLWHYRSKHEHLIAFSNQEIYKNELVTFPSSVEHEQDCGVEFEYVKDGFYEGGGRNCNVAEAKRCVELIRRHIDTHPERSLGIIAFSEKQQQQISLEVQRFREQHPEYEFFFKEGKDEEFFVKNLENVQGDERDTIFFSICYAQTKEQKEAGRPMHMRFGPLGHQGGERRLNVAITRAKRNVKLISSILPSDIDLSRTESEGVRMLRSYIEFAMNGSVALASAKKTQAQDQFVDMIGAFIENSGYTVRKYVGCSGYRIDIAVVDSKDDDKYIAGIECDGYSYVSAHTARDRDHLRKSVLNAMGWNMYRVWSAEWYINPEVEGERLIAFIRESEKHIDEPIVESLQETSQSDDLSEMVEDVTVASAGGNASSKGLLSVEDNPYGFERYVEANWWDAPAPKGYYDNTTSVLSKVLYIVGIEQPIHKDLLYQRMAGAFGNQKATSPVRRTVDMAMNTSAGRQQLVIKDDFVTLKGFTDVKVRIPEDGYSQRAINLISTEELGLAMIAVASNAFGLSTKALIEETTKAIGYSRRGEKINTAMNKALEHLISTGKVRVIDDKVTVVGGV